MIEQTGYALDLLRESADFTLYRGRQLASQSPVLVVALAAERPSSQGQRRLEHEYALAGELDPAWAAKPIALTRHEQRTVLVLQDPGGEPLSRIIEQGRGQVLDLTRVLRIGIGLAAAVGQVHRRGLIHKDLKPENVFLDDAGRVWLTGFGIASRLPRERQSPAPPEIIAGTFAYMAPEQTGCMNRSMDARSDLYSLGIILYEMLTGALPFAASDPLEWVHCHIARQPAPPGDRTALPEPVSFLTMKLLAKNAEERYQTAEGLEADLRRCLEEWDSLHRIDSFPLGRHDSSDRLLIPEKLYGREPEIDALLAAFERVVTGGTPEVVLVSGYSGVGKSSVVSELHKVLVPPRGLFAAGKFDQYKRDIPYATLAQAFQILVRQILVKSAAEVEQWRRALKAAVEPNGQLIVNLVPEVEFIIGKQTAVPDLPPKEAQNRFQMVFRRFLGAFGRPEHPLALFLDDLQWLDTATLDFLEHMVTHSEVRHLLVVGAYRDNEVGPSHPLLGTLDAIRKAGVPVQDILLAPLGLSDVGRLVADALCCSPEHARPLAQLMHEKTGGNPFFAIHFLAALAEERLLTFHPVTRAWQWDMDRIRATSYTDNVVDLVAAKLKRFSRPAQEALMRLACLGNVAEIGTLALVHGETEEEADAALWEAVRAGLVLRQESSCKFLHDRIQQAAYSLIPESHRAGVHLRIGRALLAGMTAEQLAQHLFDVANQLNRGAALLIDHDEKVRVAAIDLRAGRKAKASAAYASARAYFSAGMALLEDVLLDENDWGAYYELAFGLRLERVEAELLTGDFEQAERLIEEVMPRARSKVDQAAVYQLKVVLHILKSENQPAVDTALACLRLFGIDMPAHPSWDQVKAEYEMVWRNLAGHPIEGLIDQPLMTDPELQAAMQVLAVLISPSYFTDFGLYCLHICRMVNISIQHGASAAAGHAYAYFAFVLGPVFHRYTDARRFASVAYNLAGRKECAAFQAKVYYAIGTTAFWTEPITSAIEFTRTAFRSATETGDLLFACYSMQQIVSGLVLRSDPLDSVWRQSEIALSFTREAKYHELADIMLSQQRFIAAMQGRTAAISTFGDAQFDEAAFEAGLTADRVTSMVCWYWILKLKARLLSGDYDEALAAGGKAKPLLWATTAHIQHLDYVYYLALAVAARFDAAPAGEQAAWRELLVAHQEQLREWAESYPATFADKHALVSAEIARLERRQADAMGLYEQAIHQAREQGYLQNEALAYEVAARFYAALGMEVFAHAYLRGARNCYDRWGAFGKVKQLDARYPYLRDEHTPAWPAATMGTPVGDLDVQTVVKASQALSSEIILPKLIERLMRIAVERAGAERGLLILLREGEPRIEAEAGASDDAAAGTGPGKVAVTVRRRDVTPSDLPQSALRYVTRTRERVLLDDASVENLYSDDEYVRRKHPRSILCLPILKQTKLVGAFYLENNLTPRAFTQQRVTVLELLASQAAISLENANLYSDLQRSEAFLAEGQSISHTGSFGWTVSTGEVYWSAETYNIFELDRTAKPSLEFVLRRTHPDDLNRFQHILDRASAARTDFETEHRVLMPDGSLKHLHVLARVSTSQLGNLEYVGAVTDVTAAKQAEEKLRQSEREARQLLDLSPMHLTELGPDGTRIYNNQAALDYYGLSLEEWRNSDSQRLFHPQDAERMMSELPDQFLNGSPFEMEARLKRKDGQYRWFHFRFNPMEDQRGCITRWYAAGTDIEDRKHAEQRLRDENVALREEIDKASMFEEIVGTSPSLKNVLSRISKVAPTDSSVLITGETGTGKELVARAIHRRSQRSSGAFISVNCAAVPRDLIASELFGHEKGAFTGATQRRLGRFELAEGGTIFLDEVGELPAETQIALLRVLQEREFERVGASGSIPTDVRVIAATNRDLEAAIDAGMFRSDLFYRLNVFPIEMPPLRDRGEDISLLVEYFIDRFAKKAGKTFRTLDKKSLDLLQSYPWPGNIRELQNVIERSVIISEADTFSVDESWLSRQPHRSEATSHLQLSQKLATQEKEMIEAALRESGGRVSGESGAAAKLGMPGSTLESKIKALKINKNRFKSSASHA